jgi:molecular chaperone DnaK
MHLVVYDFGGGTFDVSVVSMEAGVVEVLSSKGDTKLGGDDLDAALMKYVADEFFDAHGIDLRKSASTRWRLLQASEKAKRELSTNETAWIREEFITEKDGMPLNLDVQVTRGIYEGLIQPMIERTIDCVDQALRDAKLTINQIDDLVLVGGSTRTPLVEQRLRDEFKLDPSRAVDPDLAVALGAATQAAMHEGVTVGPVLVDVTSHTLGIEALAGVGSDGPQMVFSPIIHRNTPLPAKHEQAYQAVHDEQKVVEIHVLQGEHEDVSRNQSIGVFTLDLDGASGDRAKIVVRFDLTLDGTLKVTATQVATAKTEVLTVNNALSQFREQDRDQAHARLATMFDKSSEMMDKDELPEPGKWSAHTMEQIRAPKMASSHASSAAAMLAKARRIGSQISGEDAEEITLLGERLEAAIATDEEATIKSLCEELDDVLFYVQ